MDYIFFKFNFICNFNLQFNFTHVHDIHYMNLKLDFNCKLKLQFEISNCNWNLHMCMIYITWFLNWISICNWNWMLGKFWKIDLKGKVAFNLAYGLHHFQIEFHLQIEIAIWGFKLQLKLNVVQILASSLKMESCF